MPTHATPRLLRRPEVFTSHAFSHGADSNGASWLVLYEQRTPFSRVTKMPATDDDGRSDDDDAHPGNNGGDDDDDITLAPAVADPVVCLLRRGPDEELWSLAQTLTLPQTPDADDSTDQTRFVFAARASNPAFSKGLPQQRQQLAVPIGTVPLLHQHDGVGKAPWGTALFELKQGGMWAFAGVANGTRGKHKHSDQLSTPSVVAFQEDLLAIVEPIHFADHSDSGTTTLGKGHVYRFAAPEPSLVAGAQPLLTFAESVAPERGRGTLAAATAPLLPVRWTLSEWIATLYAVAAVAIALLLVNVGRAARRRHLHGHGACSTPPAGQWAGLQVHGK
jgi:hypothetical protein